MGYYLRFISVETVTLTEISAALAAIDRRYKIKRDDSEGGESAELLFGRSCIGLLEIAAANELFAEELDELRQQASRAPKEKAEPVLAILARACATIAVQVSGDLDAHLTRLEPLWRWLFEHRQGLLQADGEGFYDATGLVLPDGDGSPPASSPKHERISGGFFSGGTHWTSVVFMMTPVELEVWLSAMPLTAARINAVEPLNERVTLPRIVAAYAAYHERNEMSGYLDFALVRRSEHGEGGGVREESLGPRRPLGTADSHSPIAISREHGRWLGAAGPRA